MLTKSQPLPISLVPIYRASIAMIRITLFFMLAIVFIIHHQLMTMLIRSENLRLKLYLASIQVYSKITLRLLGIKIQRSQEVSNFKGSLLVCNHLSYLDALVLFSCDPSLFITSVEIRHTFLLGKLAALGGCFFVERRKNLRTPDLIENEMKSISNKVKAGFNIFLFPEGTSSDGRNVLPFKAHFFQLALDHQLPVQPMALSYFGAGAKHAPWYGRMTFADHLFRVCMQQELVADIHVLPPISTHHFTDRFELAKYSEQAIRDAYAKN